MQKLLNSIVYGEGIQEPITLPIEVEPDTFSYVPSEVTSGIDSVASTDIVILDDVPTANTAELKGNTLVYGTSTGDIYIDLSSLENITSEDILYAPPLTLGRDNAIMDIDQGKVALIDADTLVFQSCVTSQMLNIGTQENEVNLRVAVDKAIEKVEEITKGAGCGTCILFFTGGTNFRYIVYPEYKAGRSSVHGRDLVQAELEKHYSFYDGEDYMMEADDCVVAMYDSNPSKFVICSVDKDVYRATEGRHYNPYSKASYVNSKGVTIPAKEPHFVDVTAYDAFRMPYFQCLTGDSVDGIKGIKGVAGKIMENEGKAGKILVDLDGEIDVVKANYLVLEQYIKMVCSMEAYTAFEYGLEVRNVTYTSIDIDSLGREPTELELENNYRCEVTEAIKMMESTMRAVSMKQARYDFIEDKFILELWSYPVDSNNKFIWD